MNFWSFTDQIVFVFGDEYFSRIGMLFSKFVHASVIYIICLNWFCFTWKESFALRYRVCKKRLDVRLSKYMRTTRQQKWPQTPLATGGDGRQSWQASKNDFDSWYKKKCADRLVSSKFSGRTIVQKPV